MSKVLSAVFGIGVAVVVYVTMLLGIQAFYPEPVWEDFCVEELRDAQPIVSMEGCTDDMTVAGCRELNREREINKEEIQACNNQYDAANQNYGRNFFIIASSLGLLAILTSFFLLNITRVSIMNISAGVACAGIVMVLWGFMRGWESTDEKLKFVVGLIITVVVIFLAVRLNMRHEKK